MFDSENEPIVPSRNIWGWTPLEIVVRAALLALAVAITIPEIRAYLIDFYSAFSVSEIALTIGALAVGAGYLIIRVLDRRQERRFRAALQDDIARAKTNLHRLEAMGFGPDRQA